MSQPEVVVAISDIHMGADRAKGIFRSADALVSFIDSWTASARCMDLVILGDGVDFLTRLPGVADRKFLVSAAVTKIDEIIKQNIDVFSALARFVKASQKRIVWCVGNHDIELAFAEVQARINQAVLGQTADDPARLQWSVDGKRLDYVGTGGAKIRFVHGNLRDKWNSLNYDEVRELAAHGGSEGYKYPQGSVLVTDVLNPLKADGISHVDLLKPEVSVALPLTMALWPEKARPLIGTALKAEWSVEVGALVKWFKSLWSDTPAQTFGMKALATKPATVAPGDVISAAFRGVPDAQVGIDVDDVAGLFTRSLLTKEMAAILEGDGPVGVKSFGGSKARRVIERLLLSATAEANGGSDPWALDHVDDLDQVLRDTFALADAPDVVIAGHTHLARAVNYDHHLYFNIGTWASLMRIPRGIEGQDFVEYARRLKKCVEGAADAPWTMRPFTRLTYAQVDLTKGEDFASLLEWPSPCTGVLYRR